MYWLSSSPAIEETFATWTGGFTDAEIAQIIKLGEARRKDTATVSTKGIVDNEIRKSTVSWIEQNDESIWLYDKIGFIVRQLNGQFFHFDLQGFAEGFQYTLYDETGSHYDWHIDKGVMGGMPPRKLSFTIQLSDSDEYEGGDLEFMSGNKADKAPRGKGLTIAFPSWVLHRVTPITKGARRSLVVWCSGPAFR